MANRDSRDAQINGLVIALDATRIDSTKDKFRREMRDTRSTGASAGKVGLVRKDVFEKHGELITRVTL